MATKVLATATTVIRLGQRGAARACSDKVCTRLVAKPAHRGNNSQPPRPAANQPPLPNNVPNNPKWLGKTSRELRKDQARSSTSNDQKQDSRVAISPEHSS